MAFVLDDRVRETSATTGTGTLDLDGAVSGFQTFVAGIGNTNTTHYAIVNRDAAEWETGLGTITDAAPDTLARTTVYASSNADSAVNFSAGTKDVFCSRVALGLGTLPVDILFTQDNPEILGGDTDGALHIGAGATNILGGFVKFYGDTHATKAGVVELGSDATVGFALADGVLTLTADTAATAAVTDVLKLTKNAARMSSAPAEAPEPRLPPAAVQTTAVQSYRISPVEAPVSQVSESNSPDLL